MTNLTCEEEFLVLAVFGNVFVHDIASGFFCVFVFIYLFADINARI